MNQPFIGWVWWKSLKKFLSTCAVAKWSIRLVLLSSIFFIWIKLTLNGKSNQENRELCFIKTCFIRLYVLVLSCYNKNVENIFLQTFPSESCRWSAFISCIERFLDGSSPYIFPISWAIAKEEVASFYLCIITTKIITVSLMKVILAHPTTIKLQTQFAPRVIPFLWQKSYRETPLITSINPR